MKKFKFFIMIAVFSIIGGIIGGLSSYFSLATSLHNFFMTLDHWFALYSFPIFLVVVIGTTICSWILYFQGKKNILKDLENDEEIMDESLISWGAVLNNIIIPLGIVFFINFTRAFKINESSIYSTIIVFIFFFVSMFLSVYLQRNIINFLKSYNPNIYDDILDKRFTRKYIDSVDERERYEIYKAGFKAYSRMMKVVFFSMIFASFLIIDQGGLLLFCFY